MPAGHPTVYEIKKYPNRRFYDVTRSRHCTLSDLYEIVQKGDQIVVTDSKTGHDITNVVLTQIILEHDPPKMDLFPASLLHQAIQANQQMVRKFIDDYFAQAVNAFSQSRKQFDEFVQRSGLSALNPAAPFDWVRMLLPSGMNPIAQRSESPSPPKSETDGSLHALRAELDTLRAELSTIRATAGKKRKPSSKRPRK